MQISTLSDNYKYISTDPNPFIANQEYPSQVNGEPMPVIPPPYPDLSRFSSTHKAKVNVLPRKLIENDSPCKHQIKILPLPAPPPRLGSTSAE
ncbi:hypothetical protein EYC80_001859 [Monilinia laxa]|uniref:Uncharacterized protein n=1 Tax=Monilinia laxa TaxID=61186 RepID=A0A5N6K705_MONLA|nr:hypothetical protein EYC80_001859 [Monilinia laxa]